METKAKKKTSNIIMVLLIAVIAVCGILAVGMLKGWFGGSGGAGGADGSGSPVISGDVIGVANMERSNVGYSLESGVVIESGDIVETKSESEAPFTVSDKNSIILGEKTELGMNTCEQDNVRLDLTGGEMFLDFAKAPKEFQVTFGDSTATTEEAVFSISKQPGSAELNVYGGKVTVDLAGTEQEVAEGSQLQIFTDKDGKEGSDVLELKADTLNAFMISKLQACESGVCFSQDELAKVVADREAEKKEAAKALEQEAIAVVKEEASGSSANVKTCTISINCKTILSNMDNLTPGKNKYVPSNGVILATSKVQFRKGDTVFDVLKRVCSAAGIQLEYSDSSTYGGKYVEGINHLYEFDCGQTSGWMYKVNGWYPNYGCSSYKLKDGDSIVWSYTCSGK